MPQISPTWTIRSILAWTTQFFIDHRVESPRLDAEIILAHSLGLKRMELYIQMDRPLNTKELALFKANMLKRARDRFPIAYITGEREFWSLTFKVTKDVLIPRPDTECLVEFALDCLKECLPNDDALNEPISIVDVGTGSGAIALALASELPAENRMITCVDISQAALQVAEQNAKDLQLTENVSFLHSDLLTNYHEKAHLIVSNPPYIDQATLATLSAEVKQEPQLALDGGLDGLQIYRQLISQAIHALKPNGWLALEIGFDQGESVSKLMSETGFTNIIVKKDYSGLNRVVAGKNDLKSLVE